MAFNILAGMQYAQQQGEEGRQRGQGQFAAKLLGEAYNSTGAARQDALGRLAGRQPQVAMQADQQFRQQDAQMTEDAFKRLQTHAQFLRKIPAEQRPQAWAQLQPRIAQELPEYAQYLPSQWDEASVMPVVEQLATMGGDKDSLPSSVREAQAFQADPSLMETRRQMYGSYSYGEVDLGDGTKGQTRRNSRTGEMEMVLPGGRVVSLAAATVPGGGSMPAPDAAPPPKQPPTRMFSIEGETGAAGPEEAAALEAAMTQGGTFIIGPDGRPQRAGAPGADLTMRQPVSTPAVNRPLPSINDIGGGPIAPLPGSGRGGMGFGESTADKAAAAAQQSGMTEAAKIAAQQAAAPRQAELDAQAAEAKASAEAGVKRESAARTKAPQINNVVRGITRIDSAMQALDGGMVNTGPLDQYAMKFTAAGQELEAAVGAIKNDLLSLTRVPGVGSQSDLEQRIADLKYPQIGFHPEVNRRNLEQLRAFIRDVEESISGSSQQAPAASNGGSTSKLVYNPATGDFD